MDGNEFYSDDLSEIRYCIEELVKIERERLSLEKERHKDWVERQPPKPLHGMQTR